MKYRYTCFICGSRNFAQDRLQLGVRLTEHVSVLWWVFDVYGKDPAPSKDSSLLLGASFATVACQSVETQYSAPEVRGVLYS